VSLTRTPYGLLPAMCVRRHAGDLLRLEGDVAVYINGSRQGAQTSAVDFCSNHDVKERLGFKRAPGWRVSAPVAEQGRVDPPSQEAPLPAHTYYQGATAVHGAVDNQSQLESWTAVYTLPEHDPSNGSAIDFWLGVEPRPARNDSNLTVLQPVISWFGGRWSGAAWNCCPKEQAHEGQRFHLQRPFSTDVAVSIRRAQQGDRPDDQVEVFVIHMDAGFSGGKSTLTMAADGRLFGWFMAVQENHGLNESAGCEQLLRPGDRFTIGQAELRLRGSTVRAVLPFTWHHAHRACSAPVHCPLMICLHVQEAVPNLTWIIRSPWHHTQLYGKCGGAVQVQVSNSSRFTTVDLRGPRAVPPAYPPAPPPVVPAKACLSEMRALCTGRLGSWCRSCVRAHWTALAASGCDRRSTDAICSAGLQTKVNLTIVPADATRHMVLSVTRSENETYEVTSVLGISHGKALGTGIQSRCYAASEQTDDNYYVAGTSFGHYMGGATSFSSSLLQLRVTQVVQTTSGDEVDVDVNAARVSLHWAHWSSATTHDYYKGVHTDYPGNISICDSWPACQTRDVQQAWLATGRKLRAGDMSIHFNGLC
jgi:hypothetical protein